MTAPTVSTLPTAPSRTQSQAVFRTNADNFVAAQSTFVTECNTLGTWMNDQVDIITGIGSGFVGNWSDQTGVANIPYSVTHNGLIWVLTVNLADISASEPSDVNSDWISVEDGNYANPVTISTTDDTQLTLNHTDGTSAALKMQNTGGEAWVGSNNDDLILYSTSSGTEFFRSDASVSTFNSDVKVKATSGESNVVLESRIAGGNAFAIFNDSAGTAQYSFGYRDTTGTIVLSTGDTLVTSPLFTVQSNGNMELSGNVGIGVAPNANNALLIDKNTAGSVLVVKNSTNNIFFTASGTQSIATGANGANAAIRINMDGTTSRSINAAGTINASGADYAEYVKIADWILIHNDSIKNNQTLTSEEKVQQYIKIKPGDVIGFDHDGKVTNRFSEAVSGFAVKSTNPSIVGGDAWAFTPRPELISPDKIEYVGTEKPEPILDEGGNDLQNYSQYEADQVAYKQVLADEQMRVDALNEVNHNEWFEIHERERAAVDRIAFCGVVPFNFEGPFNVGDYIIAIEGENDSISAKSVPKITSFDEYDNCFGRVQLVEPETGRPILRVKAV